MALTLSSERTFSVTGGVRIGWVNATWPFAKLIVSPSLLRLATILGTYDFLPSQVVSLERYGSIPIFSSGVRIIHARPDYPHKIVFWCIGNSEAIIEKIHQAGFLPAASAAAEVKWRGVPVRWTAVLFFVVIWNALFLPQRAFADPPVTLALIPLVTTFLVCWAIRKYPQVQKVILRDGRTVTEIQAYLSLFQMITGLLSLIFAGIALGRLFT